MAEIGTRGVGEEAVENQYKSYAQKSNGNPIGLQRQSCWKVEVGWIKLVSYPKLIKSSLCVTGNCMTGKMLLKRLTFDYDY